MQTSQNEKPEQEVELCFRIQVLDQLKPILKGYRRYAGLTQAELAEKLGITQQSYAELEANPERVSVERLFIVLAVMGVKFYLDGSRMPQRPASAGANKKKLVAPSAVKPPPGKAPSW